MALRGIAEVAGARLAWWEDGDGPALVLVHAGVADARMWEIDPSPELRAFARSEERAIDDGRIDDAVELIVRMWAGDSRPDVRALVGDMQRTAFELQPREGAEDEELEPPVSARLAAIDVPTAIAIGDRDVADFERVAQRLHAELPRATLRRIAGAGHLLALNRPAAVARLVARHLEALTPPASPPP